MSNRKPKCDCFIVCSGIVCLLLTCFLSGCKPRENPALSDNSATGSLSYGVESDGSDFVITKPDGTPITNGNNSRPLSGTKQSAPGDTVTGGLTSQGQYIPGNNQPTVYPGQSTTKAQSYGTLTSHSQNESTKVTPSTTRGTSAIETQPPGPVDQTPGNTPGNIAAGGGLAAKNGRIYYADYGDYKLYAMNMDGSGKKKLSDDIGVHGINVVGDRVYYTCFGETTGTFSIKIDGTDRKKLSNNTSGSLNVVGGRLYYANVSDQFALYSMKTDGSDTKKLVDVHVGCIMVDGGRIYYTNSDENYTIYTVKIDGTDRKKLSDDSAGGLQVVGGRIYYYYFNTQAAKQGIYSIKTDGTDRKRLYNQRTGGIHVAGDTIYYVEDETSDLCSIKIDGSNYRLLNSGNIGSVHLAGDRLYFLHNRAVHVYDAFSMKTDGSDWKLLAQFDKR